MRVAYFTAGSHGAGHLVRGLALRRALLRIAPSTTFALFSPASPFQRIAGDCFRPVVVDAHVLRDPATAPQSDVARALGEFGADVVVIDVFWVPLVFVPLSCPSWLLLRSVPPKWLIGPREARFDAARHERVFAIEPAPGLARFDAVDPVVVVDPDDVPASSPYAGARVIVQAGLPADRAALADAAARIGGAFTTLDLHDAQAPFPAAPLLAHAAHVVTTPGYNAYWEARLLGYAPRTTFVPIARVLDDAAWRAALPTTPTPMTNGAHTLARLLVDRFDGARVAQPGL